MPLVGVIKGDTVARVIQTVQFARADTLLLFAKDEQFGHVQFRDGELADAALDELQGEDALEAFIGWESGLYTLIKGGQGDWQRGTRVVMFGLDTAAVKKLEPWLKEAGFEPSAVDRPEHFRRVVSFVQPTAVICSCPQGPLAMDCAKLADALQDARGWAPGLLIFQPPEELTEERARCLADASRYCSVVRASTKDEVCGQLTALREDRAALLSAETALDEFTPHSVTGPVHPTAMASGAAAPGPRPVAIGSPTVTPMTPGSTTPGPEPAPTPQQRRSATVWLALAALFVAGVGAGLYFVGQRGSDDATLHDPRARAKSSSNADPHAEEGNRARATASSEAAGLADRGVARADGAGRERQEQATKSEPSPAVQLALTVRPAHLELVDATTGAELGQSPVRIEVRRDALPFSVQGIYGEHRSDPIVALTSVAADEQKRSVELDLTDWVEKLARREQERPVATRRRPRSRGKRKAKRMSASSSKRREVKQDSPHKTAVAAVDAANPAATGETAPKAPRVEVVTDKPLISPLADEVSVKPVD